MTCPRCRAENHPDARLCVACGWPLVVSLGPGSVVASRYEIQSPLGAGGMGFVFKAHDRILDETVALKVVRPARDRKAAQRFRSEIKLARKVRHRNVCGIHEYGEEGELAYISMEYVGGKDLKQLLAERGALPWEEAYDVALQVVAGLQAVHEAGVLHRDLKPANVMRDARGTVRVMDFGIAKMWGQEDGSGLTASGHVVGSPEYMSPEQARGRPLDFASDVYSFGVLAYELFTGQAAFRRDTPMATMLAHLEEDPPLEGPAAAQIPQALVPVLRRALSKQPTERYPACADLLEALRAARAALELQATDAVSGPLLPSLGPASAQGRRPPAAPLPPRPDVARLLTEPLRRALGHVDPTVRAGAAAALASMAPEGTAESDVGTLAAREQAADDELAEADTAPLADEGTATGHKWRWLAWLGAAVVLLLLAMLWLAGLGRG